MKQRRIVIRQILFIGGGEEEREQTTASKAKEFIKLVKSLNREQQAGLYLVTEGLKGINENKKRGRKPLIVFFKIIE